MGTILGRRAEERALLLTCVHLVLLAELLDDRGVHDSVVELESPGEEVDEAHACADHPAPASLRVVVLPDGGRDLLLGFRQLRFDPRRGPVRASDAAGPSLLLLRLPLLPAVLAGRLSIGPDFIGGFRVRLYFVGQR